MNKLLWTGIALLLATGCLTGGVRQSKVMALGVHPASSIAVVESDDPVVRQLGQALAKAASEHSGLPVGPPSDEAYRIEVRRAPPSSAKGPSLEFSASLFAPGIEGELGEVRYRKSGEPLELAERAGGAVGKELGDRLNVRRHEFFERRAFDDRIFFASTPLTLQQGEFVFSDDEVLLARVAVGLTRRVQLNTWFGGFGMPAAGAAPLAFFGAVAGAGIGLVGLMDVGLKVNLLDETATLPGVAVSYDVLDLFGGFAAVGGAVAFGGGGVAAVPVAGGGGANLQFNLLSLSVGKHFGATQLVAGSYLLDNHHFLPQGVGEGAVLLGGSSQQIPRFPTVAQPFVAVEHVVGPRFSFAAEVFPRYPWRETFGTTGGRWNLGWSQPKGFLALDRVRFRVDLAALILYFPPNAEAGRKNGAIMPEPWLGLGLDFL